MDSYEKKILRKWTGVGVRDAVVYQIVSTNGDVVYIGVTNNLRWRASEHLARGTAKIGETIRKIAGPMPRRDALQRETDELRAFARRHGRPPERNRTLDGKYHDA